MPGYGVLALKSTTDHATSPRPSHPSSGLARIPAMAGAPRATRPPTASSHARDESEKKAHGCEAWVSQTENADEDTATRPRTATAAPREGRRRSQANEASRSTAGQTR